MTKRGQLVLVSGATLALGVGGYLMVPGKAPNQKDKTPRQSAREMVFPVGLSALVGDPQKDNSVCHEYYKKSGVGSPDIKMKSHRIQKDFKNATEAQKRQWIIDDTLADIEETPLACNAPVEDWFFDSAYAQNPEPPMCEECGGGCHTWTCPAIFSTIFNSCLSNGGNCAITYTCCAIHCPPPTCG